MLLLLLVSGMGFAAALVVTLVAPQPTPLGRIVPSVVAYSIHAGLGTALNRLGLSPAAAAIQWSRAASHARNPGEVEQAGRGIALARGRNASDWRLDDALCDSYSRGSTAVRTAIADAGTPCSPDADVFNHVAVGEPLGFTSNPPVGGPHYPQPYPDYGLSEVSVAPGYWVHNLEHGAVVLLYRCPTACPAVTAELQGLYDSLATATATGRQSPPRLLITQYDEMAHAFAIVAWGRKFEIDQFDRDELLAFYRAHIDRGPECRNLVCPA